MTHHSILQVLSFIAASIADDLSHNMSPSAGTSGDNCGAQDTDKGNALYIVPWLVKLAPVLRAVAVIICEEFRDGLIMFNTVNLSALCNSCAKMACCSWDYEL
jgi:hypothetical protein